MNVASNVIHWWKLDSKQEKKYTWLLLILQLWPVYRGIKVDIKMLKKLPGAEEEKKKFEAKIVSLEPYLESLPSVFVMSLALLTALHDDENWVAVVGETPTSVQ